MVPRSAADPMAPIAALPRRFRGPLTRWPRTADAVLAVIVLVLTMFTGEFRDPATNSGFTIRPVADLPVAGYFVAVGSAASLFWRRRRPLTVLTISAAGALAWVVFGYGVETTIGLLVALYTVGRYVDQDSASYVALGGGLAVVVVADIVAGGLRTEAAVEAAIAFLPWYVGRRLRIRQRYLEVLEEQADYLEREQQAQADRAVDTERARIARELHDVVAHRVSLMTVQAGAAKTVAEDDPRGAHQAMEAVEEAGRQALGELRHLLGVLRPEAGRGELGPQPGVADIGHLVERVRDAGVDVVLLMDTPPSAVPVRVDLSAYRIVQEALTNVVKHAGPDAAAVVSVSSDHRGLRIEVTNTGGTSGAMPESGHGILGMRERAHLLGGTFEASPYPDGRGFRVEASLPLGMAGR